MNLNRTYSQLSRLWRLSKRQLCSEVVSESATSSSSSIILKHDFEDIRANTEPSREAWIETLTSAKGDIVGTTTLHPDIFGVVPRVDIIFENVEWQTKYKDINYEHARLPVEMRGPGRGFGPKPWPQKGTGRARQGSRRAPQWHKGGTVHGPRMFTTKFYMLPFHKRLMGLTSTLSCKLVQDDLKVVDSLSVPSDEAGFLKEIGKERFWGDSVLFVNEDDVVPRNIALALEKIPHYNILPVYGLNVHSMLKHDTLVVSVAALRAIEERLIYNLNRTDFRRRSESFVH